MKYTKTPNSVIFYPEHGKPLIVMASEMEEQNLTVPEIQSILESFENRSHHRVEAFVDGIFYLSDGTKVPFKLIRDKGTVEPYYEFYRRLQINPYENVKKTLVNFICSYDYKITNDGLLEVYKAVETEVPKSLIDRHLLKLMEIERQLSKDFFCIDDKLVFIDCDTDTVFSFIGGERTNGIQRTLAEAYSLKYLKDTVKWISEKDARTYCCDIMVGRLIYPVKTAISVHEYAVDPDPGNECSYGLHVGNYDYAKAFGTKSTHRIARCLVDPENVVAVPANGKMGKIRVKEFFLDEILY